MNLIPKTVVVTVPVNIPELRGRHATTPPHGVVSSFRAPIATMQAVDLAISRIDSSMSRALFLRLAVENVARAFNEHYDEIQRRAKELSNGHGDTARPA